MSQYLTHLNSAWALDQAIVSEDYRIVIIRFGHDWDPVCYRMDDMLYKLCDEVASDAAMFVVDIDEVPDFNIQYDLYDPCTVMFFYHNKHVRINLGFGGTSKLTWTPNTPGDLATIIRQAVANARNGQIVASSEQNED